VSSSLRPDKGPLSAVTCDKRAATEQRDSLRPGHLLAGQPATVLCWRLNTSEVRELSLTQKKEKKEEKKEKKEEKKEKKEEKKEKKERSRKKKKKKRKAIPVFHLFPAASMGLRQERAAPHRAAQGSTGVCSLPWKPAKERMRSSDLKEALSFKQLYDPSG